MSNSELVENFSKVDVSDFPAFETYSDALGKGLWVLWVAKEKLNIKKISAEQIALIIRDVQEIGIDAKSIINSFNRAGDKLYIHKDNFNVYYEIMKPGKEFLLSLIKKNSVEVIYFEPDKEFTSKRVFSENILDNLKGELKIVDPYCGEKTLHLLHKSKNSIKFLTKIENLQPKERNIFLQELNDFKKENQNMGFKNYPFNDIHDRYIISQGSLIILGHSIKSLGSKESFAIVLDKTHNINIVEALIENFNRRWKKATPL